MNDKADAGGLGGVEGLNFNGVANDNEGDTPVASGGFRESIVQPPGEEILSSDVRTEVEPTPDLCSPYLGAGKY